MQVKRGKVLQEALREFSADKFVVANVIVLVLMFLVAIAIRLAGFAPASYLATAVEGAILDNDSTLAVVLFVLWLRARPNPQQSIDSDCQRG